VDSSEAGDEWPPYAFVPDGPWPHPSRSPAGRSEERATIPAEPIDEAAWQRSAAYLRGAALFNAGYYWEAHEVWEALWHAHGHTGPTADLLKALIKLAAAGVKVRQRQPRGVATHGRRAAELLTTVRDRVGPTWLGLDLEALIRQARAIAEQPPTDPAPAGARVSRVFQFQIAPGVTPRNEQNCTVGLTPPLEKIPNASR
jgi:predicted metal-dependent hydrolase